MNSETKDVCEICTNLCSSVLQKTIDNQSVTSDSFYTSTKNSYLFHCSACNYFFTKTQFEMEDFYSDKYSLLHEGFFQDQIVFLPDGAPIERNRYQADYIKNLTCNLDIRSICDIGCGKGLTIKLLSEDLNNLDTFVYDLGQDSYKLVWEKYIPTTRVLPSLNGVKKRFDLVYSFFVAEHVENLDSYINTCINLINEDGAFIACLPDIAQNHGDIFVSDHLRHMSHANLQRYLNNTSLAEFDFKIWTDQSLRALFFAVGKRETLRSLNVESKDNISNLREVCRDKILSLWPKNNKTQILNSIANKDLILWGSQFYGKLAALTLSLKDVLVVDGNPHFQGTIFSLPNGKKVIVQGPETLYQNNCKNHVILLCMNDTAARALQQKLPEEIKAKAITLF